ncbi:zinc transporter [Sphingomonas vulcanisoli]|uniref:Zinc transporter n=1 Tax=Sphingomonas vulcanisoli TaxID=1658060 RepID=A0ABX0TVW4_9SPHN|nr:zinc transporter ZntB [Sphingomonas vulcanisoli]NIJ09643.1 zinc transporter [Sphingomonas vulcanisoli]
MADVTNFAIALGADGKGHDVDPAKACGEHTQGRFAWVHLVGHSDDTFDWLRDHGDLPETVIYALTAIETRPRTEPIEDGALINMRGLAVEGTEGDKLVSIRCWVEAGRAITVSYRPLDGLDGLVEKMRAGEIKDPGDLVSLLAVVITKRIDPVISDLGDLVDDCETALEPKNAYETRRKIAEARSDAIVYRRFVVPQREALTRLAALEVDWLEDNDRLHLRETADRFARMAEELEAVRERSALIHEQLTDLRSELIETRALWLSIVALVFLPLTFLTGLLGMNVEGIPFAHEPWAFGAVCALCTALGVGVLAWFAKAHWFGR